MNNVKVAAALRLLAEAIETPAEAPPAQPPQTEATPAAKPRGRGRPVKGEGDNLTAPAAPPAVVAPVATAPVVADPFADTAPPAAPPVATLDDVRNALKALREATSQETALKLLADAGGGATNLTGLKPEFYGAVVAAAQKTGAALDKALPPPPDPFDAAPAAPAAKPLTLEEVRAVCIATQKRTSVDTVQKVVMKHGGHAADPAGGPAKPSFAALPPSAFAAVVAELQALPSTK